MAETPKAMLSKKLFKGSKPCFIMTKRARAWTTRWLILDITLHSPNRCN